MQDADLALHRLVVAISERGESFATATIVRVSGSIPNGIGAKMVVTAAEGRVSGTVGGGRIEHAVIAAAQEAIAEGRSRLFQAKLTDSEAGGIGMMCGGSADVFIDVHRPAPHVVLCGAGHINLALHRMAAGLGFRFTVIDDRPEWANATNFPGAAVLVERPEEAIGALGLGPDSFVIVGTREGDRDVILAAARTAARYIGVVASKRKAILLGRELVAAAGETLDLDRFLPRFHAPVGLALGGRSPEAVALSILAELQALRYGEPATSMRISPEDLACYIARERPRS
jgi:xanthine dehydrogenase accessory factor